MQKDQQFQVRSLKVDKQREEIHIKKGIRIDAKTRQNFWHKTRLPMIVVLCDFYHTNLIKLRLCAFVLCKRLGNAE